MQVHEIQREPLAEPVRIVVHWTGGTDQTNSHDRQHYHFIIEGDGEIMKGVHSIASNNNTAYRVYAAHVRGLNTGSIGIALAGMGGSKESPFHKGPYPLKAKQFEVLAQLCAHLINMYELDVTRILLIILITVIG